MAHFSQEVIQLAQETERKYGVPASVTLAQYALESGYGTSKLAKNNNNYFGITGSYNGNYTESNGRRWRKYDTMAQSFDDHGALLAKPLYADKTAGASSVGEYIDAIAETYAPSSDGNNGYAAKLKSIIAENNLTQYDGSTWAGGGVTASPSAAGGGAWYDDIISNIVLVAFLVVVGVMSVVFFMVAFDLKLPSVKKVVAG